MYSAVMMIAMATSPEAANCHRNYGCYGGCYGGYAYGGCYGGNYRGGGYYSSYGPGYGYPMYSGGPVYYGAPGYTRYYGESPTPIMNRAIVASAPAPVTVEVTLPPDAKLQVDSKPIAGDGSMRRLISPPVDPGQDYTYLLTATVMRDGKERKVEKRITVHAGQTTRVTLEFSGDLASR